MSDDTNKTILLTGFIGAAVLQRLLAAGHAVTAVARSESSAAALTEAGATALVGDLTDRVWLVEQLQAADGAVHTAAGSDENDPAMNEAVIDAALEAYAGSDKPFVHTGGAWTYGSGSDITEQTPSNPPQITAWRVAQEQRLLAGDARASVVQPGIVYGHGQGIPTMLLGGPRDDSGALTLIGDGTQHWTTVHVDDLAELYVLVLDAAPGGSAYVAVGGVNPTVRELGEAAGPVVAGSPEEAEGRLGAAFAEALLLDQQGTGAHARELGWSPSQPTLVEEIRAGYGA